MSIQTLENQAEAPAAALSPWKRIGAALLSEYWLVRLSIVLIFGLYVRTIGFAPVYDDNIIGPPLSLRDIPLFFTHDIFGLEGTAHSVYYRPLAQTYGLLLTLATGGLPGWLHLGAMFLHLAVFYLAYRFGRHLFGDYRLALLTALLFALHPTKVESVAWIGSSCVDGLGGVFFFACMIMIVRWREKPSGWLLAASVAFCTCAIFTKETMVCIPVLIAVYLWLTLPPDGRIVRILKTALPYGVVTAVYLAIRHVVIAPPSNRVEYSYPTYTLNNLWTAPYAIWWYLRHLSMPWGLSVEYTSRILHRPGLYEFVLPAVALLLLLAAGIWLWSRWRSPVAAFLMFWFVLTLAPPVIVAPMVSEHDRYLYFTAYAFCALVAWASLRLGGLWAKAPYIVALCVVFLWSGLTWHEMGYWDCDKTLWSRVLETSPSQSKAIIQMAQIYCEEGDSAKALDLLNEGLRYYPTSPRFWLERARTLNDASRFEEARTSYLKVMQLTEPVGGRPVGTQVSTNARAMAAHQLAIMDLKANNLVEAESYARTAVDSNPEAVSYHTTLSEILGAEGRRDEAEAESKLELQMNLARQLRNRWSSHP
jgi:tetratricopeptide (TPR) repeat protein